MSDSDCTLIGNLTRDPEMKFTPGGAANAKFGIAVNRKWTDRNTNEKKEEVAFFNIVCWGSLAENVCASLVKGQRIIVNGRLTQRTWKKDDGTEVNMIEVNADNVGPDLRWATADVSRVERDGSTTNAPQPQAAQAPEPATDAWGEQPF